jgi:hypothetical protein
MPPRTKQHFQRPTQPPGLGRCWVGGKEGLMSWDSPSFALRQRYCQRSWSSSQEEHGSCLASGGSIATWPRHCAVLGRCEEAAVILPSPAANATWGKRRARKAHLRREDPCEETDRGRNGYTPAPRNGRHVSSAASRCPADAGPGGRRPAPLAQPDFRVRRDRP